MPNMIRKHAVIGLGIVSTVASTFILTRISIRKLYQRALERSQKRMKDNASSKHQTTEHRGSLGETKIGEPSGNHITELTIRRCTCLPVAYKIINRPEIRKIMSAFEKADAIDCKGSQRHIPRDKIIEAFSLGIDKLSLRTLMNGRAAESFRMQPRTVYIVERPTLAGLNYLLVGREEEERREDAAEGRIFRVKDRKENQLTHTR
ncbi:hypothetical protein BOTCAL_0223g00050 [Botryotinia calthae]|uniref:Uncharacterized protein n=1 Tax=Botryotinia calthae TaxID=38488 RepID=A0A4Y8CYV8_9HELO|nr:hypothetical protein BOTCAL_0223g00050 [Botryotinia calthae]